MIRKGDIFAYIRKKAGGYCRILPRLIAGNDIFLRFVRMKDMSCLRAFSCCASSPGKNRSSLFLWKELFDTYQAVYIIQDKEDAGGIIGSIGLYGMIPGESSYISLMIFNEEHRMCGYGSRSMALLLNYFKRKSLAEHIYAEVLETNEGSRSFLNRMGFKACGKKGEVMIFEKCLKACGGPSGS